MKKLVILMLAMVILATGCAITQNGMVKDVSIDFKQYKTVSIDVIDKVGSEYSKSGVEVFKTVLNQRICTDTPYTTRGAFGDLIHQGLNYKLLATNSDFIQVTINYFKPVNVALRWLVGFGSGKGGLGYTATFTDNKGVLATLEGGQSYGDMMGYVPFGDMESSIYRGQDSTKMFMIVQVSPSDSRIYQK
jgi:hypothetical protein